MSERKVLGSFKGAAPAAGHTGTMQIARDESERLEININGQIGVISPEDTRKLIGKLREEFEGGKSTPPAGEQPKPAFTAQNPTPNPKPAPTPPKGPELKK